MIRKVNETSGGSTRLIFASFDEGLRSLAVLLFTFSADDFSERILVEALTPYWSLAHAERIAKALVELLTHVDDEDRRQRQAKSSLSIDEMIQQGEQFVLSAPGIS